MVEISGGRSHARVQHIRCQQCYSAVVKLVVVPAKEFLPKARASSTQPKRSGNSSRYLRVSNWLSECGLSSDTSGWLWVLVPPRAAIYSVTDLEVIEVSRSAWMVRSPVMLPCSTLGSAISSMASSAVLRGTTIQPTT